MMDMELALVVRRMRGYVGAHHAYGISYPGLGADLERVLEQHTTDAERIATLSASVERLHGIIKAVLDQAGEWADLAPPDDWGEGPHDAVLSDAGRAIQRIVKDTYKEASHED
jgi:hypothetical protein